MTLAIPDDLTPHALATLHAALRLSEASDDGEVAGGARALETELRRSRWAVLRALIELEERRLVRREPGTRARAARIVVLVRGARTHANKGSGGKSGSGEWRKMRARLGGYERAMREVQEQRDEAKREAEALRRKRRLDADPALVGLLADLAHSADCTDHPCERCEATIRKVEAARADYATEGEIVERLEHADALVRAGAELLASLQDRGIGAAMRRADAARAFAAAVQARGELEARA
jgi:hypothetical protein